MQRRWKWIGHVLRMQNNRLPLQTFMANPGPLWKRPKGGVRMTTKRYFHKAAESFIMVPFGLSRNKFDREWQEHIQTLAMDRVQWRCITQDTVQTLQGCNGR